jgi:hypothetical protein
MAIIFLNSIIQLSFVMVKCDVLFEVNEVNLLKWALASEG